MASSVNLVESEETKGDARLKRRLFVSDAREDHVDRFLSTPGSRSVSDTRSRGLSGTRTTDYFCASVPLPLTPRLRFCAIRVSTGSVSVAACRPPLKRQVHQSKVQYGHSTSDSDDMIIAQRPPQYWRLPTRVPAIVLGLRRLHRYLSRRGDLGIATFTASGCVAYAV